MGKGSASVLLVVALLAPATASAQVAWDAPLLLPPRPEPGFGIFLTSMHAAGIGVMVTWRAPAWNYGLRAGIADQAGPDGIAVFGGLDYSAPLNRASADFPIDIDWLFGAGLGIGDGVRVSFPLGLTGGHTFRGEGVNFTPFLSPRVVLDGFFGDDRPGRRSGLELDFAVDLGIDLRIIGSRGPFGGTTIRFGASLGDRDAIGIGIVF